MKLLQTHKPSNSRNACDTAYKQTRTACTAQRANLPRRDDKQRDAPSSFDGHANEASRQSGDAPSFVTFLRTDNTNSERRFEHTSDSHFCYPFLDDNHAHKP
jgi:hypothetical protein